MLEELRYSIRSLTRTPGLTVVAILTVALGVGAGTALFSVVKAVMLDPLPFAQPERLAWIAALDDSNEPSRVSMPDFQDWRRESRSFARMAAYGDGPVNAGGGDVPQRTYGAAVTPDFFPLIGVKPLLGRTFSPGEEIHGGPLAVLLGHGLWQRAYGGDPGILGRSIHIVECSSR